MNGSPGQAVSAVPGPGRPGAAARAPGAWSGPARASLWYGAALYFNSALLLFATPVFTRLLSAREYGEVVLYNSWSVVLGLFATLSLSGGVFQAAMLEFARDLDAYASAMVGLSTVSVLVCFALACAAIAVSGDFTGLPFHLLAFMFAGFLFNATLLLWQALEKFHYRYRLVVATSVPASFAGIVAAIALVALVPAHRVESRIVAAALPGLLVGLAFYCVLLARGKTFYSAQYWRYALALTIPLLPHYLSQSFVLQFDRFVIERVAGRTDVGIYGLACAVASGLTLFWTAINASWVPWMMRRMQEERFRDIAARAADLVAAVALVCVLLALAAPEIVALLAPPPYRAAAGVVPVLLLASYLQFAQSLFLNVQFFRKRSVAITQCSVLAALLNVACNLYFIRRFGFTAAAWVIAASQLFQLVFHYVFVRRRDPSPVIDGRHLGAVTCGAAFMVCAATVAQSAAAVRWALFAAFAAALAALAYRRGVAAAFIRERA